MSHREGPLFGALLIGCGIGFLYYQKYEQILPAVSLAVIITVLDYVVITQLKQRFRKK